MANDNVLCLTENAELFDECFFGNKVSIEYKSKFIFIIYRNSQIYIEKSKILLTSSISLTDKPIPKKNMQSFSPLKLIPLENTLMKTLLI